VAKLDRIVEASFGRRGWLPPRR